MQPYEHMLKTLELVNGLISKEQTNDGNAEDAECGRICPTSGTEPGENTAVNPREENRRD